MENFKKEFDKLKEMVLIEYVSEPLDSVTHQEWEAAKREIALAEEFEKIETLKELTAWEAKYWWCERYGLLEDLVELNRKYF